MSRSILKKNTWPEPVWWAIALLLLLIVSFQVRGVWERFTIEREMRERRVETEAELQTLEQKKVDLEERVRYMSDERGLEEELRQNFDVALPGERVFVLTGETVAEPGEVDTAATTTTRRPWYRFW